MGTVSRTDSADWIVLTGSAEKQPWQELTFGCHSAECVGCDSGGFHRWRFGLRGDSSPSSPRCPAVLSGVLWHGDFAMLGGLPAGDRGIGPIAPDNSQLASFSGPFGLINKLDWHGKWELPHQQVIPYVAYSALQLFSHSWNRHRGIIGRNGGMMAYEERRWHKNQLADVRPRTPRSHGGLFQMHPRWGVACHELTIRNLARAFQVREKGSYSARGDCSSSC